MKIKSIKLCNFRCFLSKTISFTDGVNILFGMNACGKTTVIEAVNYLALTKSFKTNDDREIINVNRDEMSLIGEFFQFGKNDKILVMKKNGYKTILKNSYQYKKISDYLGEVLVVAFSSFDLNLLLGYSKERRKIFEPIICQISKDYVFGYNLYNKVLNDRNALLKRLILEKNNKLIELLDVVDLRLVDAAKILFETREKFVLNVNEKISKIHKQISSSEENLVLKYKPNIDPSKMLEKLKNNYENDLKKGTTSVGPHKDDFLFEINGMDVAIYGSQGQQRNALISSKIAFLYILEQAKNKKPILLLDDVFSELDPIRQNNIFNALDDDIQVIISTASLAEIDDKILKKANVITLNKED